jgi:predicted nuclease with TOPRIM domain
MWCQFEDCSSKFTDLFPVDLTYGEMKLRGVYLHLCEPHVELLAGNFDVKVEAQEKLLDRILRRKAPMQIPNERAKELVSLLEEISYVVPEALPKLKDKLDKNKKYLETQLLPNHAY